MQFFADSIIYSYAQIFFSSRKWFGIAAMLSTFVIPEMGAMALGGVVISNLLALYLKYDRDKIRSGFYGFNGILFGAASSFYFQLTPFMILIVALFVVVTFFISVVLEHYLEESFNLPGLSLPFIISLYIFFIFLTNYNSVLFKGFEIEISFLDNILPTFIKTFFQSYALILFQSSIYTGIILAVSVMLFSRVNFVNSIIAYTLNYLFLSVVFPDHSQTFFIQTSFNTILTSFALGGSLVIVSRKTPVLLVFSVLMVIVFTGFFTKFLAAYQLPVLVFPFNVVVLSTIYSLKFRQEQSDLTLLYFKPGSPEQNYYYHQNRKRRFDKFLRLFPELPFFGEWYITQGIEGNLTHKEEWKYAWDFEIADKEKKTFRDKGDYPEDYFCYNIPVAAPLDGQVVRVIDHVSDNQIGDVNLESNWGNTIVIDHGEGLFSSASHLKPESIKVRIGDSIKKGQIIASCGNSGRSPVPHLHFQFQLTDKIGDKTYKFPFAHYLEKSNGSFRLKAFNYPAEKSYIRNIETHKALLKAFKFRLGDEFNIDCELDGEKLTEKWEVKVDILNQMYIENDKKDIAYMYPSGKVFYFSNYIGRKKTALYFFYLLAIRVPLGYMENLSWDDEYPVSITVNNFVRFLAEYFLVFSELISSRANFHFRENPDAEENFVILSDFENRGKGIFSFFNEKGTGALEISQNGKLLKYDFMMNNLNFKANINQNRGE